MSEEEKPPKPLEENTPTASKSLTEEDIKGKITHGDLNFEGLTIPAFPPPKTEWYQKASAGLTDQKLVKARFRGASLTGVDFGSANVAEADFQDADLTDADLSEVLGLTPAQLAGANLTRCKLPQSLTTFTALTNVAELSKNAGTLFSILLVGCAFVLLVAFSTKDVQLILDSGTAKLPVIDLQVSPRIFLGLAPWVLLGQYVTMHLYLQRLWSLIATLPAIFPDALPLDKKTYPWLLNDMVRQHFPVLQQQPWPLAFSQIHSMRLLSYWLAPLTALLIYCRCLMMQDVFLSYVQIAALVLFYTLARLFQRFAALTLQRPPETDKEKQNTLTGNFRNSKWHRINLVGTLLIGVPLICIGPRFLGFLTNKYKSTINVINVRDNTPVLLDGKQLTLSLAGEQALRQAFTAETGKTYFLLFWRGWMNDDITLRPTGFEMPEPLTIEMSEYEIGALANSYGAIAEQQKKDRTEKTAAKWSQLRAKVSRADLSNRRLRFLQASKAFLVNVNLYKSVLNGANLSGAQLQGADLREAQLQGTDMQRAQLQQADLTKAELQGADLKAAQLQDAVLMNAQLQGADLRGSQLQDANLFDTNLQGAKLSYTKLQGANLSGAQLQGATLGDARLQGASFRDANLQYTNLTSAKIEGADFSDAIYSAVTTRWPNGVGKPPKSFTDPKTGKSYDYEPQQVPEGDLNPTGDPNLYRLAIKY
ncbi:MAG: pentapeptide repeat-containing protein [Armatimonas sp.]